MTVEVGAPPIDERERLAHRLLDASATHQLDPATAIDWSSPLRPDLWFMPPEHVTLFGTSLWQHLPEPTRRELSRHEAASTASVGIWCETILLQLVARHIYGADPTSAHVAYALTEVADECRHSIMFARMIRTLGVPAYGPGRLAHTLGLVMKSTARPAGMFGAILVAEELLDAMQRQTIHDERVQPVIREICRLHVVEEARHVRFARDELTRIMARSGRSARVDARLTVAQSAALLSRRLVHPDVYRAVGLDTRAATSAARSSEHRRDFLAAVCSRLVAFFDDVGLIDRSSRRIWQRAGLITRTA
ncbi:MAG TPA: diiron oxygenase [Mycobacteriales bacterium]|nr:diiron oxygenase [Mycobacteriales bacterium]